MPVVDTSFLVALRNLDDAHHKRALKLAEQDGPFYIPAVSLHEYLLVVWSQTRQHEGATATQRRVREALQDLRSQPVFSVEPEFDPDEAYDIFMSDIRLSYADAVGVSVAKNRGDDLLSFDRIQLEAFKARRGPRSGGV